MFWGGTVIWLRVCKINRHIKNFRETEKYSEQNLSPSLFSLSMQLLCVIVEILVIRLAWVPEELETTLQVRPKSDINSRRHFECRPLNLSRCWSICPCNGSAKQDWDG